MPKVIHYTLFHDNIALIDEFVHVLVVDNYVSVHLDNFEIFVCFKNPNLRK